MTKSMRALMCLVLTLCMMYSMVIMADASSPGKKQDENVIVLRTEEDWARMREHDAAEYEAKINSIDPALARNVTEFLNTHSEMSPLRTRGSELPVSNSDFIAAFVRAYPQYAGQESRISKDVELLRTNVVAEYVKIWFRDRGYDLALDLFSHSLMDNPATASMSLTGNTDGMYGYVRGLLTDDPFLSKMKSFANKSGTETVTDSSYTFDTGDLYWSIHGFTWTRNRTSKGTAKFSIDDVYDFNKWQDIPGVVAGLAGTHEFDIQITGLVQDGVIK